MMASSDNYPAPSAPSEKDIWESCLFLVVHKGEIPATRKLHSDVFQESSFFSYISNPGELIDSTPYAQPQLNRTQMVVYALVSHNDECYDRVCEFLTQQEITVLKEPAFDTGLTDAVISDRVEFFEVLVKGSSLLLSDKPTISADASNRNILDVIFVNYENLGPESFTLFPSRSKFQARDLFDEENLNILRELTRYGTEIRFRHEFGGAFLHFAAAKLSLALARILLDNGADVSAVTQHGRTALHYAIEPYIPDGGSVAMLIDFVCLLLQHGSNINETVFRSNIYGDRCGGATPLHFAVIKNLTELVVLLLELGADINADSGIGNVLYLATQRGLEILTRILAHGPDLNCERNRRVFRNALKERIHYDELQNCGGQRWQYHVRRRLLQAPGIHIHNATILRMFEEHGFGIKPHDVKDIDLVLQAADSGDIRLLNVLLKWGAGVHFRSTAVLKGENGDIIEKVLIKIKPGSCNFETLKYLFVLDDVRSGVTLSLFKRFSQEIVTTVFNLGDKRNESPIPLMRQIDLIQPIAWKVKVLNLNQKDAFFLNWEIVAYTLWQSNETFDSEPPKKYFKQVTDMKEKKIGDSAKSFYDFLDSSDLQNASLLKNRSVAAKLKLGNYREMFPDFASIIEWRFIRANFRRVLLDKGMIVFNYLFKDSPKLPDEMVEWILDSLTNLDLLVFVNIGNLNADVSVVRRSDPAQELAVILENP